MCTVLLPPGVNPIAVNIYIISYYESTDSSHANNHTENFLIQQTVMQKPISAFYNPATPLLTNGSYTASWSTAL